MDFKKLAKDLGFAYNEFCALIDVFIETTRRDISRLERALAENDTPEITNAAHSIKGAAGNIGFADLYEAAKQAETYSKNNEIQLVKQKMATIKMIFDAIVSGRETDKTEEKPI